MDSISKMFLQILNMGITASYVILAVLLIRAGIKKAPKIYSYALWFAVGFRLICPVSFSSFLSIFNLNLFSMDKVANHAGTISYIPSNLGTMVIPEVSVGIPAADQVINSSLPAGTPYASINPIQVLFFMAMLIWQVVMLTILFYSIVSYIQLKNQVSKAVLLHGNIYECDTISTPFVLGLVKPKIYIPFHLTEQEQNYILKHEQYHIKRLDYLVKPLSFLLLIVYWFNPLVWIAYYCMCRDMEMSCDEKVLMELGYSVKKDYSNSLLSFSTNRRFPVANPLAFGETGSIGRIKNVLNFKKPRGWIVMLITVLCIIVVFACTANPLNNTEEETAITEVTKTTDISDYAQTLFDAKNPYIGDASADGKLIAALGIPATLGEYTIELDYPDRNVLRIVFAEEVAEDVPFEAQFFHYSGILLALIDNADEIQWSFPTVYEGNKTQLTTYINDQNFKQRPNMDDIKTYGMSTAKIQELIDLLEENFPQDYSFSTYTPGIPTVTPAAVSDENSDINTTGSELSMDTILAQQDWANLNLDYFRSFQNLKWVNDTDEGVLNSYVKFTVTYEEKPYSLYVSYLKEDSSIDMIYLMKDSTQEVILLYSVNSLYEEDTDIISFLQRPTDMGGYVTYELPEPLTNGAYYASEYNLGGNLFLVNNEDPVVTDYAPKEWCAAGGVMRIPYDKTSSSPMEPRYIVFENGVLVDGNTHDNHTSYIGEPILLEGVEEQALLREVDHDLYTAAGQAAAEEAGNPIPEDELQSLMWEIYFAREDGNVAYLFFLNEKYFTKEQAIAFAQKVNFTDIAFD